ncbi:MAG: glycosyltransferase family 39 protein [Chloracidobacterium sp.]|uniref:Glycosyltransferase family 39 protein n=1 Tax=Chloracidobacterium validum TaxID=2821543 RepID=A0ABX8BB32_9BACT|nr:glycosyltransferase family 39 protein [Chloracidobacterium validum]QUW03871.1 glycosyltransferase family 39 protein [Chloracidobacterium validum]
MPDPLSPIARPSVRQVAFLLVTCGVAFFWQLGGLGLLGPDEPRYAQVAREMWQRGDWITPTLGGTTWFEKPALLYWLIGLTCQVTGFNEWGARLPSAIAATLTVLALGCLRPIHLGWTAAVITATSPLLLAFARATTFEALLTFAITSSILMFYLSFRATSQGHLKTAAITRWLVYVALGVGVLAKGLVGLVLPLGSLALFMLLTPDLRQRPWQAFWRCRPVLGGLIFAGVAGLWYAPVIAQHGWAFIEEFFIAHHLQRFTSNRFRHPGPPYYYVPIVLAGIIPWTPFWLVGVYRAISDGLTKPNPEKASMTDSQLLIRLALCAFLFPLLFFSISGSKLPGYILPAIPFAGILAAHGLWSLSTKTRLPWLLLASLSQIILYVVFQIAIHKNFPEKDLDTWHLLLGGWLITAFGISAMYADEPSQATVRLAGVSLGMVLWLTTYFPVIEGRFSTKPLATIIAREARPGEIVAFFRCREYAPVFYNPGHTTCCDAAREPNQLPDPAAVEAEVRKRGGLLVIFPQRELAALQSAAYTLRPLGTAGRFTLARLVSTQAGEIGHD